MKFSWTNMAAAAPVTATSEHAEFPATFSREPQRRYKPWRSLTVGSDVRLVWDLASMPVSTLVLAGLVRTNFETCRIQANASDSWSNPTINRLITVKKNRWNRQYQHTHVETSGMNLRFVSLLIPAQTPVILQGELAPRDHFLLGGIYLGALTEAPGSFAVDFDHEPIRPFEDRRAEGDAWEERDILNNPRIELTATRRALFSDDIPYLDTDDASLWLDIDANCWDADHFYLYEDLGNPAMGWLVRQTFAPAKWEVESPGVVKTTWGMREVTR
jgi:hypothetical protein